jgi:hypothetical protein
VTSLDTIKKQHANSPNGDGKMAKFSQTVFRNGEVIAIVTASDHGAVAAAARKTGLPMEGMHAVRTTDYMWSVFHKSAGESAVTEGGWEVDDTGPDCAKKDAELFAKRG